MKLHLAALLCFMFSLNAIAQRSGHEIDPNLDYKNQSWGWINEAWTGDNASYTKIAENIRKQIRLGKDLEKAWDKYLTSASKNPKDAKAQFARAFFLANMNWGKDLNLSSRGTGHTSELLRAWQGLVKAPSPCCREYSRIRFLINCQEAPQLELTPMGKRLHESDPKDRASKYYYAQILHFSKDRAEMRQALALAKEIVASTPKEPSSYRLLAACYSMLWIRERDKKNAHLAIENYQRSIDLSKDKDWNRWAAHLIKVLRDEIKKAGG